MQGARLRWCDLTPSPLEWADGGVIPPTLEVAPNGHKTCPERNCGKFTLSAEANGLDQLEPSRFLPALPQLLKAYRAAGRHLSAESPVFVKTKGGGTASLTCPPPMAWW